MAAAPDPRLEVLVDEARRRVQRQASNLDEVRARASWILSAAAISAAFLSDATLSRHDRLGGAAIVGIIAFVVTGLAVVAIFVPKKVWRFVVHPEDVRYYIEDCAVTMDALRQGIARDYRDMFTANVRWMRFHNRALALACVSLMVELVAFLLDLRR
jgi:hypothetical protein